MRMTFLAAGLAAMAGGLLHFRLADRAEAAPAAPGWAYTLGALREGLGPRPAGARAPAVARPRAEPGGYSIGYVLDGPGPVRVELYGPSGTAVALLDWGVQGAGAHRLRIRRPPGGAAFHFYRIRCGARVECGRLLWGGAAPDNL